MLEKDFQYYLDHQNELLQKYTGRFIVIKESQVIGDYSSELEAINTTKEHHEIGTFLVQKCLPGDESFSATYHSRFAYK
jgi:hypothetical protein